MRLGYKIATRFLKSNLGQTLLIILGISIGVSVQIFIGSLIQGLQKSLVEKTIGDSSQITVLSNAAEKKISNYNEIIKVIEQTDSAIEQVLAVNDNPAFFQREGSSKSLLIRGANIEDADRIYNIINRLVEGTYPKDADEIILGVDLKEEYGIELNEEISFVTTQKNIVTCKVVGFFDLQVASINNSWAFTTLQTSQIMFESGDTITSIEMQVNEEAAFKADEIASKIEQQFSAESFKIQNWKAQNEQLLSGLQGQSISSIMIQVFVLISVVLGIASVLAITVMQKSKQIGILKAMGLKNSSASYVFLFEGLILGFFGAILGIIFGLGLSFAFTKFALNPDGTPVIALYISYPFIFGSGLIAIISSTLAALIPAIKSSKLNPIDIIRNN